MHILDLAQNSIAAGATRIEIGVAADSKADTLSISITDNGRGMEPNLLSAVTDPFTTTRTTRRVGLGVPMMAEAARACGGSFEIDSRPGEGTSLTAGFRLSHIDRAPLGDIAATLVSLVAANPDVSVRYEHTVDGSEFVLDTDEVTARLDGVPINEGPVLRWLADYLREHTGGID